MLEEGLPHGVRLLRPLRMLLPNGDRLMIKIDDVNIKKPSVGKEIGALGVRDMNLYPAECRMKHTTYAAPLQVSFKVFINDELKESFQDYVPDGIPMMIKSLKCNLRGLSEKGMVQRKEDSSEIGGYFITNGNERIIRFLTAPRRNFPRGSDRKTWKDGALFSEFGVEIRCVRQDQISSNMILHYLNNGTAFLKVWSERMPVTMPLVLVLKALCDVSDFYIYKAMTRGLEEDSFYTSSCVNMLQLINQEDIITQQDAKKFIGAEISKMFGRLNSWPPSAPWDTHEEKCDILLEDSVAPHLKTNEDKFNLLIFMLRKLFAIAKGKAALESPDNPMFHELHLSGFVFFELLLDRLQGFLYSLAPFINKKFEDAAVKSTLARDSTRNTLQLIKTVMKSNYSLISRPMHSLVATGNLVTRANISPQQKVGLSVVAEKINYWRFVANFKAVHRGGQFADSKTTECRKLYPESWGFQCPVHTPDGGSCGLLNHLTEMCVISTHQTASVKNSGVYEALLHLGMIPIQDSRLPVFDFANMIHVLADGMVLGLIPWKEAESITHELRIMKATGKGILDNCLEVSLIPWTPKATQFPGLYIFSGPSRMLRPVLNLNTETVELIGTFEQPYLDICIVESERTSKTTHKELRQTAMLSLIAGQIPYPDFNQSPRNMYCCQMGKQTMGVPSHTLKYRSDTKMYQIHSPQSPLVRPVLHDHYRMDDFPLGTNAVVAVISYTGYDMEDALILNKSSVERGLFAGGIFKTELVDLKQMGEGKSFRHGEAVFKFGRRAKTESNEKTPHNLKDSRLDRFLDQDGLPIIGTIVKLDDPLYSYLEVATNFLIIGTYRGSEPAEVIDVKLLSSEGRDPILQRIAITLFVKRDPTIGDKFANRHGQKGICSFLWPQESMPFTESGMTPDVIFNPHGYPSRMTIGMMLESMAGKSAASHAVAHDATPFTFDEDNAASDYYGRLLEDAGFNYFGTESMYSGVDGRQLEAKIFVGLVYYIRLRHMVSDKWQARSLGPVDQITHQPVHGRKRGGGIRFGEMERDSLLAHGASFLLHDRLFKCSDESRAFACSNCGSIVSTTLMNEDGDADPSDAKSYSCRLCLSSENIVKVSLPYVLKYLVSELASVNINCNFKLNK